MLFALLIMLQCISLVQVHAASCTVKPPGQLRVAFRGPNAATISWSTSGNSSGGNDVLNPLVQYGTSSSLLTSLTSPVGTTTSYRGSTLFFHNVPLFNLTSSTTYYYKTVSTTCVSQSATYSFKTPPPVGSTNPVNITFLADLGIYGPFASVAGPRTIAALKQVAPYTNFFVHNGDIAYADNPYLTTNYEAVWNGFQNAMLNITANYAYMTGPGNHEATCSQVLGDLWCAITGNVNRNFTAYRNRFRMPGNESGGQDNMWYSFDYGLVHVVVIDTETDFRDAPSGPGTSLNGGNFSTPGAQLTWFQNDLANANSNRGNVPWIIVTGHRPFFSSVPNTGISAPTDCSTCGRAFIPYILQYNVDLYIAGHVHWYERFFPININGTKVSGNYTNSPGFIHIVNGAAAAGEGKPISITSRNNASANIVNSYGYVQLQIKDRSKAVLRFIDTANNNNVTDTIDIVRNH